MRRTAILLVAALTFVAGVAAVVVARPSAVLPEWLAGADVLDPSGTAGVVQGWVRKVEDDRIVHVTRGLLSLDGAPFVVGPDTEIRVRHKIGSIHDLHEGVNVKICYDVRGNGRSARIVEVPSSDTPCRVMAATSAESRPSADSAAAPIAPAPLPPPTPEPANARATVSAPAPTEPEPAAPARAEARRARPTSTPRASGVPTSARVAQPAAAPRVQSASEREAPSPPAVRRETREDGHDYGAAIDFVLRR